MNIPWFRACKHDRSVDMKSMYYDMRLLRLKWMFVLREWKHSSPHLKYESTVREFRQTFEVPVDCCAGKNAVCPGMQIVLQLPLTQIVLLIVLVAVRASTFSTVWTRRLEKSRVQTHAHARQGDRSTCRRCRMGCQTR